MEEYETLVLGGAASMRESASRASMHGWRLLETLEAVSAEKMHACYGECFFWLAPHTPLETSSFSPSSTSGSVRATVARLVRLPVSGSVK